MFKRIVPMLLFAAALPAWGAPPLALTVDRVAGADGVKIYQITSSGAVNAAPAVVWRILTDYDRMAEYVPDLASARVVSRSGDKVLIEQRGGVRFLLFSHPIHLVVQAHEQAPRQIDVTLVEGDMLVYRASWELTALPTGGTRVQYNAAIAPKFYVPAMIGTSLVRKDIANMMAAVLARLDRDE